MKTIYKSVNDSKISISELMLPSHTNFSGHIHGGYILSLMDQIAFACASKFSGHYCVTASVDTVDFLQPINVGELVTMKASVNYVGRSSMIVGIRVEAENIQSGEKKHCNSSYFTMVAKDKNNVTTEVPGLILSDLEEVRRFHDCLTRIDDKKQNKKNNDTLDYGSESILEEIGNHNVKLEL